MVAAGARGQSTAVAEISSKHAVFSARIMYLKVLRFAP